MSVSADFCPDCGHAGVNHSVEYMTVGLRCLISPLQPLTPTFDFKAYRRLKTAVYSWSCAIAERFGLGSYLDKPDDQTLLLTKVLWEAAPSRGIKMREFRFNNLPRNSILATLPNGNVVDFDSMPMPKGVKPVWWLDNKAILKKRLSAAGVPVPRGEMVGSKRKLKAVFEKLTKPLIVKPVIGSASRHTTLHINTLDELERAFASAKRIAPFIVVEEELKGSVYRPTVLEGKLVATLRRDTPHVLGDGVHTIDELVSIENTNPKRAGPYFSKIDIGKASNELHGQSIGISSVLPKGSRAQLHPKINWSVGGTTTDVTDEVHPENKILFERIAELLGAPLVGIDFIIEDISKPWQEQRSGVIECNTMPYFDNHHLPFTGTPRDIAGPYWDMYLKRV